MFENVKKKLLDYVDFPEDKITESTEIVKDLQMNSFDIISLLGDLEDEYGVTLSQEKVQDVVTVGDLVAVIKAELK